MNTTVMVLMAATLLHPTEDVASDEVDLIEVNHFFDGQGRLVFDQVIFYDWSPKESRFNVRAWRLLKSPAQIPRRNWKQGDFSTVWHDGDVLRSVRARGIHETWTQYDPELLEREFLPKEKRRDLRKPNIRLVTSRNPQPAVRNPQPTARESRSASQR